MAAAAAEAAEDEPRASMMAAPRFCTVVMKSPRSQSSSPMTPAAGFPPMRALAKSGNWVAEWLPQMATFVTSATGTPAFAASCALARFSSRRVMANQRSAGTSGAFERAMRQLVLQGLPTTRMRTSEAAFSAMARPCGLKMPPFTLRRSPRSMPALRGTEPTSNAHDVPSKAVRRSDVAHDVVHEGEGAVVDLHDDALEHAHGGLDLEQAQHDRLVLTEELARRDAEQDGVADLAAGAGDGDVDGGLGHGEVVLSDRWVRQVGPTGGVRQMGPAGCDGAAGQRRSTMAAANSEHFTSVAPSISRAKS